MAVENFLDGVWATGGVDAAKITINSSTQASTSGFDQPTDAYLYKPVTVAGDFAYRFAYTPSGSVAAGTIRILSLLGDRVGSISTIYNAGGQYLAAKAAGASVYINAFDGATGYEPGPVPGVTLAIGTTYYFELKRVGTVVTLSVFSDSAYANLLGSITHTQASVLSYTTIHAIGGYGFGAVGNGANADGAIANFDLGTAAPITINGPTDHIIQRDAKTNSAQVQFSGTYSGAATSIEMQILDATDLSVVVPYFVADPAPANGVWSATITVPAHRNKLFFSARVSNNTTAVAQTATPVGVGALILCAGQSNLDRYFSFGTGGTPDPATSYIDTITSTWGDVIGAGGVSFANLLREHLGVPVGIIDTSVGGAALLSSVGALAAGWVAWMDSGAGDPYPACQSLVNQVGGKIEAVCWWQGEADANASLVAGGFTMTQAMYESDVDGLGAFINNRIRTDFQNGSARPNIPFFICPIGRHTGAVTDQEWQAVRDAHHSVARRIPDCYVIPDALTLTIAAGEVEHYDTASYIEHSKWLANAVRAVLGTPGGYYEGPTIRAAHLVDSQTVDVKIRTHDNLTIHNVGAAEFRVLTGGAVVTVQTATITAPDTVRLTFAAGSVDSTTVVQYLYGANPTATTVLRDSSGLELPLHSTGGVQVSDDDGTAHRAVEQYDGYYVRA